MNQKHWHQKKERGNTIFLWITIQIVRYCPTWLIRFFVSIIVFYFYLTSPQERQNIRKYQNKLCLKFPNIHLQKHAVFKQFAAFGEAICDRFAVWQKKITYADIIVHDDDNIYEEMNNKQIFPKGQIFICSHLGNIEICRALVSHHKNFVMNVLVYSQHAEVFNQALKKAGADEIQLIQVNQLNAATMLELKEKLNRGEWIAIAADRTPVNGGKIISVPFLNTPAFFPQGPWLLAGILGAPINLLHCTKYDNHYHLSLKKFCNKIEWNKQNRQEIIKNMAQNFANELEKECSKTPLQWFNFYDFWNNNNEQ